MGSLIKDSKNKYGSSGFDFSIKKLITVFLDSLFVGAILSLISSIKSFTFLELCSKSVSDEIMGMFFEIK